MLAAAGGEMNQRQKGQFEKTATSKVAILQPQLTTGVGIADDKKQANGKVILELLQGMSFNTVDGDMNDAAAILGKVLALPLKTPVTIEWQRPPKENPAAGKLKTLLGDASAVSQDYDGIYVQLDCDQLKHQPPSHPIGTRQKGGGNKFNNTCDAAWHQLNTMAHMAEWARALTLSDGETKDHGQSKPVNKIHYEGFCLLADGKKYVSFHCYPADNNSALKL
jgi:hypothetical protein